MELNNPIHKDSREAPAPQSKDTTDQMHFRSLVLGVLRHAVGWLATILFFILAFRIGFHAFDTLVSIPPHDKLLVTLFSAADSLLLALTFAYIALRIFHEFIANPEISIQASLLKIHFVDSAIISALILTIAFSFLATFMTTVEPDVTSQSQHLEKLAVYGFVASLFCICLGYVAKSLKSHG